MGQEEKEIVKLDTEQAGHRTSSLSEGFYLENINNSFFLSGGAQVPNATQYLSQKKKKIE